MGKIKNVALPALLLLTITGFSAKVIAGGGVRIKVSTEEKKAVISLIEVDAKYVNFTIENESESLVYFSTYVKNTSDFTKVFDLSELSDGKYLIVTKWDGEIVKNPISIIDSKVVVEKIKSLAKPAFKLKDENLFVILNNQSVVKTRVSISSRNEVFFEDESYKKKFSRSYDLSNLPEGSYEVCVLTENEVFYYALDLID